MPCNVIRDTQGRAIGFACSRGRQKVTPCAQCGAPSTKLCDGLTSNITGNLLQDTRTCDKPLCDKCAVHVEPDKDYCSEHKPKEKTS